MSTRWLPDVNVWLALSLPKHVHHPVADAWFRSTDDPAFFCRAAQQGVLRLLTTASVMTPYKMPPLSNRRAQLHVDGFLNMERIRFSDEPERIAVQWGHFADSTVASPKLWMDAYLAAFAVAGGYRLVTTDRAFKQFKGLNVLVL